MLLLGFSFEHIEDDITLILSGLEFKFLLRLELDSYDLFLAWLKFALHRINGENLTGHLLLHTKVELHRVHTVVLESELFLFGFADSDRLEVEYRLIIIDLDVNADLESFSAEFDGLGVLLDTVALGVLHLESDFG